MLIQIPELVTIAQDSTCLPLPTQIMASAAGITYWALTRYLLLGGAEYLPHAGLYCQFICITVHCTRPLMYNWHMHYTVLIQITLSSGIWITRMWVLFEEPSVQWQSRSHSSLFWSANIWMKNTELCTLFVDEFGDSAMNGTALIDFLDMDDEWRFWM